MFKMITSAVLLLIVCKNLYAQEYVFILGARGNSYWQALKEGIQDVAKHQQIKAVVYELQSDNAAEEQLNICLTAILRKPKLIAMSSLTPAVAVRCFQAAKDKGIQVADIDAHLLPVDAQKEGLDLLYSVGSDNYLIGVESARYAARILSKQSPRILVLEGSPGNVNGEKRARGFRDELKKVRPDALIVASVTAEWDRLKAMDITNDILLREPELDLIYCANDLMALGAAEAIKIKRTGAVKIIGIDGIRDARTAVLAGKITATVAQLPYLIGKRSVELALAPPKDSLVITPTLILDKDTLTNKNSENLQYLR